MKKIRKIKVIEPRVREVREIIPEEAEKSGEELKNDNEQEQGIFSGRETVEEEPVENARERVVLPDVEARGEANVRVADRAAETPTGGREEGGWRSLYETRAEGTSDEELARTYYAASQTTASATLAPASSQVLTPRGEQIVQQARRTEDIFKNVSEGDRRYEPPGREGNKKERRRYPWEV